MHRNMIQYMVILYIKVNYDSGGQNVTEKNALDLSRLS